MNLIKHALKFVLIATVEASVIVLPVIIGTFALTVATVGVYGGRLVDWVDK
jgi:hypothetical protein